MFPVQRSGLSQPLLPLPSVHLIGRRRGLLLLLPEVCPLPGTDDMAFFLLLIIIDGSLVGYWKISEMFVPL